MQHYQATNIAQLTYLPAQYSAENSAYTGSPRVREGEEGHGPMAQPPFTPGL